MPHLAFTLFQDIRVATDSEMLKNDSATMRLAPRSSGDAHVHRESSSRASSPCSSQSSTSVRSSISSSLISRARHRGRFGEPGLNHDLSSSQADVGSQHFHIAPLHENVSLSSRSSSSPTSNISYPTDEDVGVGFYGSSRKGRLTESHHSGASDPSGRSKAQSKKPSVFRSDLPSRPDSVEVYFPSDRASGMTCTCSA